MPLLESLEMGLGVLEEGLKIRGFPRVGTADFS